MLFSCHIRIWISGIFHLLSVIGNFSTLVETLHLALRLET
jgi:hypothetical protein